MNIHDEIIQSPHKEEMGYKEDMGASADGTVFEHLLHRLGRESNCGGGLAAAERTLPERSIVGISDYFGQRRNNRFQCFRRVCPLGELLRFGENCRNRIGRDQNW